MTLPPIYLISCHFHPKTETKNGAHHTSKPNHPSPYLVHSHGILVMWEMARRNDLEVYGLALLVGRMSWWHGISWHLVPSKQRTTKLSNRSFNVQMGPIVTYHEQIQGKGVWCLVMENLSMLRSDGFVFFTAKKHKKISKNLDPL